MSTRLLRVKQAAHYLGISPKAVRKLINCGQLHYIQLQPGNSPYLIDIRDLDRFIESRKTCA